MQNLRKIDDDDDEIEVSQTHPCSILAYQSWENKINLYGNKCIKIGQVLLNWMKSKILFLLGRMMNLMS